MAASAVLCKHESRALVAVNKEMSANDSRKHDTEKTAMNTTCKILLALSFLPLVGRFRRPCAGSGDCGTCSRIVSATQRAAPEA